MRLIPARLTRSATRLVAAGAALATVAVGGLVAAPSAGAADFTQSNITCLSVGQTYPSVTMNVGQTLELATTGSSCHYLWWSSSVFSGYNSTTSAALAPSPAPLSGATTIVLTAIAAGSATLQFEDNVNTNKPTLAVTVLGSGGSSSDETSGSSAPVPAALTLDLSAGASGAACTDGSVVSGYVGQWLALPGQGDCALPGKPGAHLLGWSTSASFPVPVAQHQVSNGWGAYELTGADGTVTAVFVPAGWSTFVSGSNTLYPVWSA